MPLAYYGLDGSNWPTRLGAVYKAVDIPDAPTPPAPLEMNMLPIYRAAPKDQLVDLAIGVQCYREDGKTPLVKIASGGSGVWSPFATSATQRAVDISTGGVTQAAVVNLADCKNLRPAQPQVEPTWTSPDGKVQVIYEGG
jgi:hypothetical protein